MQVLFTRSIQDTTFDFHRFFNHRGQLQYIASYQSGTKEEVLLLLGKDETGHWHFLYKEYVPQQLLPLETGIAEAIEGNESV